MYFRAVARIFGLSCLGPLNFLFRPPLDESQMGMKIPFMLYNIQTTNTLHNGFNLPSKHGLHFGPVGKAIPANIFRCTYLYTGVPGVHPWQNVELLV